MTWQIPIISCDSEPLSMPEVNRVETATGRLPDDYRDFLIQSNGGRPADDEVHFDVSGERHCLISFLVVEAEHPPEVIETIVDGERARLIPVADSNGQPVLMMLGPSSARGRIFFWHYELEELWEADDNDREYLPGDDDLCEIAGSFSEFVAGLTRVNEQVDEQPPSLRKMKRNAVNFAKYGDHFLEETIQFFDEFTLDKLNQRFPKRGEFRFQPVYYSAMWGQLRTTDYLINRGVDITEAAERCTQSPEVTKLFIAAGADEPLRKALVNATCTMSSTTVPELPARTVLLITESGIQPDFSDTEQWEDWQFLIRTTKIRSVLRLVERSIEFPGDLAEQLNERLSGRL